MIRTAFLPWPVYKEVRALWLPWLACALVMLTPVWSNSLLDGLSVAMYFIGAAALGALSIGQEYTDRTLGVLLCQPIGRRRLLFTKFAVLTAMLLTLCGAVYLLALGRFSGRSGAKLAMALVPVLYGLFIAPWLTMACRSPLAGTVFTLALPLVILLLGGLVGVPQAGYGPEMAARRIVLMWSASLILCGVGAVMGWRMFMRLEAIDGPGEDVDLLPWRAAGTAVAAPAASPARRRPFRRLVTKELGLQQLTLVVAGLYVLGWLAVTWLKRDFPNLVDAFNAMTIFYAVLVAILTGSFASAEERRLATLEWQMLQPMAISKQWAVKMGVVFGLAVLLAIGLPMGLELLSPVIYPSPFAGGQGLAVVVLLLSTGSLYVSTLCASGLKALVASLPVAYASAILFTTLGIQLGSDLHSAWSRRFNLDWQPTDVPIHLFSAGVVRAVEFLLVGGFIALVVRFALVNHRFADTSARRVAKQVLVIALFATAAVVVASGVSALGSWRW